MKKFALMAAAAAVCAVVAVSLPKKITLPPPGHTPSASNRPQVIPRPDGAQLKLPAGFQIDEWAAGGFEKPRYMLQAPGGQIIVSDSSDEGAVHVLTNDNGKGTGRKTLITGLYRPFGMAFWKDYLYVAETTSVKRYKFDAKAVSVGKGEEVVSLAATKKGHWTRAVLFDAKGEKMYVSVGSGSNVDAGEARERAAINRYNPDGSGHEVWAEGLRNPVSIRWYPGTQRMFVTVQERDELGDDLAPDYFTEVKQGQFFGWPYAYIGPNEDPRRKGERPDLVKKTLEPDLPLGAHVAVLDFLFYTGKQFPKRYQGGAILALHGSWTRSKRVGYSLVFAPFKNGKPTGEMQDLLTGWMLSPDQRQVWGRPVGLLQLPDGSILVSDDGGNKIWRISYKG